MSQNVEVNMRLIIASQKIGKKEGFLNINKIRSFPYYMDCHTLPSVLMSPASPPPPNMVQTSN